MVTCGSPELPGDSGDNIHTNGIHIINYDQQASDESDDEGIGTAYDGYEALPVADPGENRVHVPDHTSDSAADEGNNSSLPPILSSDAEIERQVWGEPRPQVLDLELDSSRTEQIMSAMANITLPSSAIPEWAQAIPEETWKQDLLERIRQQGNVTPQSGEGTSK